MKRKIFSILFALVLVVSFSLMTAVPVGASPGSYSTNMGKACWSVPVDFTDAEGLNWNPLEVEVTHADGQATFVITPPVAFNPEAPNDNFWLVFDADNDGVEDFQVLYNTRLPSEDPNQTYDFHWAKKTYNGGWSDYQVIPEDWTVSETNLEVFTASIPVSYLGGSGCDYGFLIELVKYVHMDDWDDGWGIIPWDPPTCGPWSTQALIFVPLPSEGYELETVPLQAEVWVDDNAGEAWYALPANFDNIQAGIDNVASDGTVHVAAGTYDENITIDKTLTLEGAQAGENARGRTGPESIINAQEAEFAVLINGAETVATFDGFTVENYDTVGILGGAFRDVLEGVTLGEDPIAVHILNNIVMPPTIEEPHNNNIQVGDGTTGTIIGNEVTGALLESPDWSGSGILVSGSSDVVVSNNYVHNSEGGIQIQGYGGPLAENNLIENNLVENCKAGISVQGYSIGTIIRYNDVLNNDTGIGSLAYDYIWGPAYQIAPSGTKVHYNNIVGNVNYGVKSSVWYWGGHDPTVLAEVVDATNNWWGDASGSHATTNPSGTGNEVSDNVAYDPWHLKQISDLTANNPTESSVDLSWTTTGAWDGDYFDVRYSTSAITTAKKDWNSARRVTGEPTPVAGASQGMKVRGLDSDTKYYFAVRVVDVESLASGLSNIASETTFAAAPPVDIIPPSAITDLEAATGTPPTKKVILSWTAKGDDGTVGIASKYIIKQSTSEITVANFDSATTVRNNLRCKSNGESESFTVRRLTPNTTYYFAIKIQDEVPNTSAISNVVDIITANLLPTVTNISPTTADNGAARTLTITGTNFTSSGTTVMRLISDDNTFDLTNVSCSSSTELTADVPTGAPTGVYKARVINDNGTSKLSSATYEVTEALMPLPVVTNLIPQMAASNTAVSGVKIFGKNFTGVIAVKFGDTTATSFTEISDTKITADVPGLTAGEYDVKVTTAGTNEVSAVKFVVSDPVVINTDTTEDTTTSEVIDLGDTNVTPVQITLTTDTSETATQATDTDAEIEVVIPPQTTVTDSEDNNYTGDINPPRVVKPDESVLTGLPEDAIVIEMGNPEETIHFDQDFVATVTVTADAEPDIYYYNKDTGAYELAGKTGIKDGIHYMPGGTVLNLEDSTYTIGLLLDHMSVYIVSVESLIPSAPPPAAVGGGGGGGPAPPPPGTTDIRGKASATGRFWYSVTAISEDKLCRLTIPRGTVGLTEELETLTKITMLIMDEPPAPPEDAHVVGLAYDFGPDGASFDPAITLTWSYEPADIPEGVAEEDLVIAYYDEAAGEWVELEGCVVENNTITAPVSHFTTFAIIGTMPPPPPPPPAPAAFSVTDLSIQPAEVEPKETVTIRLSVANTGGTEGSYSVVLKINGVKEAEKSVTIAAGKSQDVSFSVTREEVASYSVTVDGLSGSFVVVAAPPPLPVPVPAPAPAPPPAKPINWPLIGGIIGGVIVVGLGIFFLVRRRAY